MLQKLGVQARPDSARRWMNSIWLALVVGCVYTLSAQMSLALLTPDGVAVFWPAAGVAAGTLIAGGPNARRGVAGGGQWSGLSWPISWVIEIFGAPSSSPYAMRGKPC